MIIFETIFFVAFGLWMFLAICILVIPAIFYVWNKVEHYYFDRKNYQYNGRKWNA